MFRPQAGPNYSKNGPLSRVMAFKVSRSTEMREGENNQLMEYDAIVIVADTYSELITGIDELPDATLYLFFEHINEKYKRHPSKIDGQWSASLETSARKVGRIQPDGSIIWTDGDSSLDREKRLGGVPLKIDDKGRLR